MKQKKNGEVKESKELQKWNGISCFLCVCYTRRHEQSKTCEVQEKQNETQKNNKQMKENRNKQHSL